MADSEAEFVSPLGPDELLFRRMNGHEVLGRLPEYRVELLRATKNGPLQADKLLGTKCTVVLDRDKKQFRYFNGWVTAVERGGSFGRFDIYRVELRPWLWHLTLSSNCRIFQDKTALEIIESVFAEYDSQLLQKSLSGSFRKRSYCVQYRESDFDFVSRLMEEEGIYYYFKHQKGEHTLVLCDNSGAHAAMPDARLGWGPAQSGDHLSRAIITEWLLVQSLQPLKYTHTDFNPGAPSTKLDAQAQRTIGYPKPKALEVYDYPGAYVDLGVDDKTDVSGAARKEAERQAQNRVNAFESAHIVGSAATPCRSVACGYTFNFADHADGGDYLVTSAYYELEFSALEANDETYNAGFSCAIEVVPKKTAFQPQPVAVKPMVYGPQTATVVGPRGDELHTDKYGRVKVQFHWDRADKRDQTSSCWVRVSHPAASKQFGFVALPRIGDEVVIEFLEGNPDRPLITGRVYNATNLPPYELPAQATVSGFKTQSSTGGSLATANELRFDDKKGSEYIWLQAEKDYHRLVKNDARETIRNSAWLDITKHSVTTIGENASTAVGKEAQLAVGTDAHADIGGDLTLAVGAGLELSIGSATTLSSGAAIAVASAAGTDIDVGAALKISAGANIHIKATAGIVIDGGMQLSIKAGAAFITLGPDGVSITGPIVKINSGGSGGSASAAKKASPAKPKKPAKPPEHKDPLSK